MKYSVEPEEMRRIQAGDFQVGDAANVYRTDGTWATATIDDYDDQSCTYTMRLEDGRMKYCVEADCVAPL